MVLRGKPLNAALLTAKNCVFISANKCWCSGLGNYAFNSRASVSFQSLSEVSALVFILRKGRACEQAHAWDTCKRQSVSQQVRSLVQKESQPALISDLSRSQGLSLSLPVSKSKRETLGMRLNVLPLTRVFLKHEPVCRLEKRIPCFIQISF